MARAERSLSDEIADLSVKSLPVLHEEDAKEVDSLEGVLDTIRRRKERAVQQRRRDTIRSCVDSLGKAQTRRQVDSAWCALLTCFPGVNPSAFRMDQIRAIPNEIAASLRRSGSPPCPVEISQLYENVESDRVLKLMARKFSLDTLLRTPFWKENAQDHLPSRAIRFYETTINSMLMAVPPHSASRMHFASIQEAVMRYNVGVLTDRIRRWKRPLQEREDFARFYAWLGCIEGELFVVAGEVLVDIVVDDKIYPVPESVFPVELTEVDRCLEPKLVCSTDGCVFYRIKALTKEFFWGAYHRVASLYPFEAPVRGSTPVISNVQETIMRYAVRSKPVEFVYIPGGRCGAGLYLCGEREPARLEHIPGVCSKAFIRGATPDQIKKAIGKRLDRSWEPVRLVCTRKRVADVHPAAIGHIIGNRGTGARRLAKELCVENVSISIDTSCPFGYAIINADGCIKNSECAFEAIRAASSRALYTI